MVDADCAKLCAAEAKPSLPKSVLLVVRPWSLYQSRDGLVTLVALFFALAAGYT
jgi:hypothetical protein